MIKFLRNLWRDRKGNALVIAAGALPLLIGSAGFATDTIQWALWKRELQRAADSAAIAGVYDRVANGGETSGVSAAVTHDLELNNHTLVSLMSGYPQLTFPADAPNQIDQVRVSLQVQRTLPFSSLFLSNPPIIVANATAASVPGPGDPCVLSLQDGATTSGIEITGNADIDMPDCVFHTNSGSNNSAYAKGSSKVKAKSVSAVGGIQQSSNWNVDSYTPYSPQITDPYKNVTPQSSDMHCVNQALDEKTDLSSLPIGTNCFKSLSVGSNKSLTLPSGTYYVDGGSAFIQGNLTCAACTIVLTNSDSSPTATIGDFKVNADANLNMTAPTSGTFKGIAIYQDRRAVDSPSAQNKINGNSASTVQGAVYFPKQELDYNGTGTTAALCTRFVSKRIKFSGNSETSNKFKSAKDCSAYGLEEIGAGRRVRLVG